MDRRQIGGKDKVQGIGIALTLLFLALSVIALVWLSEIMRNERLVEWLKKSGVRTAEDNHKDADEASPFVKALLLVLAVYFALTLIVSVWFESVVYRAHDYMRRGQEEATMSHGAQTKFI